MKHQNDNSKKEVIKKAAKNLFFQFGLSKTSMDDIARQSHLAKPTLYYYYASKDAIFHEVVVEEALRFMNTVERKLPEDLPADEKLEKFFRTIYQDLKMYLKEISKLPESMYQNYPHGAPIVEKINELFKEKLRPLLQTGKKQNLFYYKNEEATLNALVFMTDFLNLQWMRRIPDSQRDAIVDSVIHTILFGIKRR